MLALALLCWFLLRDAAQRLQKNQKTISELSGLGGDAFAFLVAFAIPAIAATTVTPGGFLPTGALPIGAFVGHAELTSSCGGIMGWLQEISTGEGRCLKVWTPNGDMPPIGAPFAYVHPATKEIAIARSSSVAGRSWVGCPDLPEGAGLILGWDGPMSESLRALQVYRATGEKPRDGTTIGEHMAHALLLAGDLQRLISETGQKLLSEEKADAPG